MNDLLQQLQQLFTDDRHFDRQGREISQPEHKRLREDVDYWRLGRDLVMGAFRVSTVWVGLPCTKFETLVWIEGPGYETCDVEVLRWRYETEQEAEAGHRAVVEQLAAGTDPKACQRPGVN